MNWLLRPGDQLPFLISVATARVCTRVSLALSTLSGQGQGFKLRIRFHNFWVLHSKVEDYSAISHVR